jgi:hypothetical protein
MNKMKLDWETLVVESFETDSVEPIRGTVHGNASYIQQGCLTETDELSCPGSCDPATCDGHCGYGTGGCDNSQYIVTCQPTGPAPGTCCIYEC